MKTKFSAVVDEVVRTHEAVTVTRQGEPAVVVLSVEDYDSLMETLDLMADPEAQRNLAEAEHAVATGDVTSGEEMAELMAARRDHEATGS